MTRTRAASTPPAATGVPTGSSGAISGRAAGVPFVALPPASGAQARAPLIAAWHLMDPPRSEAAFAAAIPLAGLDAWRVYLGLPLTGERAPAGGFEALAQLGFEDPVLRLQAPVICGAAAEFGAALDALRKQLAIAPDPIGLMGGSIGSAVAGLVLAESEVDVRAAVLISPLAQLRPAIEGMAAGFGTTYEWSVEASAVADRLDFVARAPELARRDAALLLVAGDEDAPSVLEPALALQRALARARGSEERARLEVVRGMGHALAEEPGIEPAPRTPGAATVDRLAAAWFGRHLLGGS